jgi:two-component system NtrC family sensor kinase
MPETDSIRTARDRKKRFTYGISAKLILLLSAAMLAIFLLLGYVNTRLHRQHLEAAALTSAERISDVIRRSTTYYMLRNDREGLYHSIGTMADEPGVIKVRIFDQEGRIGYSSDTSEINHIVDKAAEACYACHSRSRPLTKLNRPDRFRFYQGANGERILGIVTPLENQPACSNAACHAHPASQQILGVLDTNLSLSKADLQLAQSDRLMWTYDLLALLAVATLSWIFIWRVIEQPLRRLKAGTERLANGDLGYQAEISARDELGEVTASFNNMSLQLRAANEEIVAWAKTLEERVEQKTRELRRTLDEVLHVEKMASVGKMAAVLAHEINNPLAGILTYAKLLRKWVDRGDVATSKKEEALQSLDLIASESRRCGDLVKNLLTFSRTAPMNLESADLNLVVERCLMLVRHQLEMSGVAAQRDLADTLPLIQCDPSQIEQVILALVMNAIDAMPQGGNLWLKTRPLDAGDEAEITVRDDGSGISPEVLIHMFEPFVTTKEGGRGVGLGLAVSRNIIERHGGRIQVQSVLGKGTTFTIVLPVHGHSGAGAKEARHESVQVR